MTLEGTRGKPFILCDTNVFLRFFFSDDSMLKELDTIGYDRLILSDITHCEIYYGMNVREKSKTVKDLRKFNRCHINEEISKMAVHLMLSHYKNKPSIPDCLIAATSIVLNAQLFTFNKKHFSYYEGIKFYRPKHKHK